MTKDLTELRKALSETDITGKLVQNRINKVIQSLVLKNNPLRNLLTRKPGEGEGAFINQRSANPTAAMVADTDARTESESTYGARQDFKFKSVLSSGSVTRKAQAIGRSYANLKAAEIQAASDAVKDKEEDKIITGDIGTDANDFDGLAQLVPAGQTLSAGDNGGALTLDLLDQAFDLLNGVANAVLCSRRTKREINALLQANQRFVDKTEVKGGFKVISYNEAPIIWSQFQLDTETKGTATNASSLYVFDTNHVYMEVLTEIGLLQLARSTSQKEEFDIFEDVVLVVDNSKFTSKIDGIIPPA